MVEEKRCNLTGHILEIVPSFFRGKVFVAFDEMPFSYAYVQERKYINVLGIKRRNATLKLRS